MCMINDAETYTIYSRKYPTARKPYRCYECRRTINVSEQYQRANGLYDGHWDSLATCLHCDAVAKWLNIVCGGYLHGGLWEDLLDHRDYNPRWLSAAVSGMSKQWGFPDSPWRPMSLPKTIPFKNL